MLKNSKTCIWRIRFELKMPNLKTFWCTIQSVNYYMFPSSQKKSCSTLQKGKQIYTLDLLYYMLDLALFASCK